MVSPIGGYRVRRIESCRFKEAGLSSPLLARRFFMSLVAFPAVAPWHGVTEL